MRIAVVDTGTNSTRLWIGDVEDEKVTSELVRRSNVTRLGDGVDSNGHLQDDAMERVFDMVKGYRDLIDKHDADKAFALFTSAARDAANGQEFADELGSRFGLEVHILKGDDEARLTYRGATSERDPDDPTPTLVVDIGGGSTELVIGARAEMSFHVSTQAGVVRQTERHLHEDPPTGDEQQELAADVSAIINDAVPEDRRRAARRMIAVAGTATSLAAIAQSLDPYDPEKVHGYVMQRDECETILKRLASVPLEERCQTPGLDPARAPTIVAGVLILLQVLELFGLDELEVSENDILRGAALEFAAKAAQP